MTAITVNSNSIIEISDEQFFQLYIRNPDTKFERNADGEVIIMPPSVCSTSAERSLPKAARGNVMTLRGGETGKRNSDLVAQLFIWNRQAKLGEVFDSSTGYKLPSGANRSPRCVSI